ncbi:NAD-dependent succinate-semialdehyde dehydrogenase [Pandoraea sp.]|uniref:NAD-dependent succinate-semialdehyde dehydrogenase n=1 Tax=Pandoraea sp. TaxID=1883445 RepID=UPI0035B46102
MNNSIASLLKRPDLVRTQAFINGEWTGAADGAKIDIENPATGEVIATVPSLGADAAERAVEAAHAAFARWRSLTAKERALRLKAWHMLVLQHEDDLATLLTAEQGKPVAEALNEIRYAASFIEWFAEEGKRVYGDTIPSHSQDTRFLVFREPVGVVAAITPWNFPSAMVTRKLAPALAAGCTVVLKPSDVTPLSALALVFLAQEAGIPKGVINVVTGGPAAIGSVLTGHALVRKLTFTGSTAVGKMLTAACAATMKKVSMELGGNAPFIVFDDADIDLAVSEAIAAKFRNTGQTCVCANRIFVQDAIYDEFVEKLTVRVSGLRLGNGLLGPTDQGPLIDQRAIEKVTSHVEDAVKRGARVTTGGSRATGPGNFFLPTVLAGVPPEALIHSEETFGPVAPITRFDGEQDVIRASNATAAGLAAYAFTRDLKRFWRVSSQLEYGMVGINTGRISTEVAPFGGIKESGVGREGSKYGIDDYTELKYVCIGGLD